MMPGPTCDEDLVRRLPLPLAQLYRRAHNAKTALERHLTAYYLWEAGLKLLGCTAVVAYAERPAHDPQLAERLQNLARPALGHWWEFVRRLLPVLAEGGDAAFAAARDLALGRARDDLPRSAGLDAVLREELDGQGGARSTVRLTELFERLVRYRNQQVGHGAAGRRPTAHYERAGEALLAGAGEVFGRLDVLGGRRLVYVTEVAALPSGDWLVQRFELAGEAGRRLGPLTVPAAQAARLPRTERVYLEAAADGSEAPALRPLHPLVVYDAATEEVLYLNARRGKQRTEYLSYTTGRVADRQDLGGEQRELLARVLGMSVADGQAEQWAARSQAEEPAAEEPESAPRRQLGEFELLSELGRGGMGRVFRAWQPSLGRQVALKELLQGGDERAEARFAREIRALARVEHPHLVRIFTSGSDGGQWFYAMELVEGTTLAAVCDRLHGHTANGTAVDWKTWTAMLSTACLEARQTEKPLGEAPRRPAPAASDAHLRAVPHREGDYVRHVVGLLRQVAEAAHALHEAGVVHRDIKPGNVMLSPDGNHAVLTDLGLAQLSDEVAGKLTRTRQFVGTLRYASPEQVLAVGGVDRRSDVYSLGVTLWELLTLRPMYGADEQTPTPELMRQIQYAEPDPPRRFNPRVSRDLEAVVLKCLEKDPRRRYAAAGELAEDLGRVLAREPVRARPQAWLRRNLRRLKRHRRGVLAAAGAAAVLLAAAGAWWYWDANYRPKVEYFANSTNRWGAIEGVGPLRPDEVRHQALSFRLTRRGGRVEKVEAVNGHGRNRPVPLGAYIEDLAHDTGAHPEYQLEYVRDSAGQVVQEVARDQSGEIAWTFHYTTATLGHFTDRNGFPRARSAAGAAYVQIDRDADGFDAALHYLSADGRPLTGQDGTLGQRYRRDERGMTTEKVNLGPQDRPTADRHGVTRVTYRRDARGELVETARWGLDGRPVIGADGVSRITFTRDDYGNEILREGFGPDDRPVLCKFGYARICSRHDEHGNLIEQWFEDEQGRPVRCKNAFARVRVVPDEHGNRAEVSYADEDGRPTRNRDGIAGFKARYDDQDHMVEVRYFDEQGRPVRNNKGYAGMAAKFDGRGKRIEEAYLDEQGGLTQNQEGSARSTFGYDDRGNKVEESYFDPAGHLTRDKNGCARWTAEYDDGGNRIAVHYWDGHGRPTLHRDGYAGYTARFDERGNRTSTAYLNADGKPTRCKDGYARFESKYDARGDFIEVAYFDEAGKPILKRGGFARQEIHRDARGNVREFAHYGRRGEPVYVGGAFRTTAEYDERGNRTEEAYWDEFGKPTALQRGYIRVRMKYDPRDNLVEIKYYDEEGHLTRHPQGYARLEKHYDEWDRLTEESSWDEKGHPAPVVPDGYVRYTAKYDERGNRTEVSYFDAGGKLTRLKGQGYARVTSRYDERGNRVEQAYWDEHGRPADHADGNHRFTSKYDERGNCTERTFFDKAGNVTRLKDGTYARVTAGYDDRGYTVEQAYWDEHGQPASHNDTNHRFTAKYDERGNAVEQVYFGPDGRRQKIKSGHARWTARHDEHDNQLEKAYFDEDDHPIRGPEGYARRVGEYDDRGEPKSTSCFDVDGAPMRMRTSIKEVIPGGQGARLGLRPGDILLSFDGHDISNSDQFVNSRKATDPPRELRILRGTETLTVKILPGRIGIQLNDRAFREDEKPPR